MGGAALWLLWPLLRPALAPARGTTLLVVIDGYHRLDAALTRTGSLPLLLITCPRTGQPTAAQSQRAAGRSFWVVRHGWNSAHQLTVFVRWLQRPSPALAHRPRAAGERQPPPAPPAARCPNRPRRPGPFSGWSHRQFCPAAPCCLAHLT
jgi:hypothetical protein